MKRIIGIIALAATAIIALSCGRTAEQGGEGSLSLGVSVDQAFTKAALSGEELLSTAKVNIYYADFSGLVRSYAYASAPQTIYLPANEYRVDVIAGEAVKESPAVASWEQKSYKGSALFNIVAGQNTSVQVKAGVINAVSKVTFASTVDENFASGYTLTIGVDGNNLVYDASSSGAEGYFLLTGMDEPAFSWTFNGTTAAGAPFSKSGTVEGIEAGKLYAMTLGYVIKDGTLSFELLVDYSTDNKDDVIVFEPVSTGLSSSAFYEIWAGHATVHADVDELEYNDPSALSFEYSSDGGSTWSSAAATRDSEGVYSARLTGLSASTEYTYRLMIAGEQMGDTMNFTTSQAPAVPNGGFERTTSQGSYYDFYGSGESPWWGSGNSASAKYGFVICKPDTGDKKEGSQSACLQSAYAVVKFAAGNLFSGYFGGLVGIDGGMVYFGRPFTGRPTALKLWLKYSGGIMDHVKGSPSGVTLKAGQTPDIGRVQIALGVWKKKAYGGESDECPILVNTTDESTFVDYATDASTIAHGDLQILTGDAAYADWTDVTIPIVYRDEMTMPTHIVISCASSMYGDYFSGCSDSRLWVDDMRLIYE